MRTVARLQNKMRGKFRAPKVRFAMGGGGGGGGGGRGGLGASPPRYFEVYRLRIALLSICHGIFQFSFSGDYFSQLNVSSKKVQNQDETSASSCLMLATTLRLVLLAWHALEWSHARVSSTDPKGSLSLNCT